MFELEVSGLDETRHRLEDLQRRIEALEGEHKVSLTELFPADFLRKYTDFESLQEMFEAGRFVVDSREDFENIPEDQLNRFIAKRTQFSSWKEMRGAAIRDWLNRKLGF